jgi:hypothetical protein
VFNPSHGVGEANSSNYIKEEERKQVKRGTLNSPNFQGIDCIQNTKG